jgi:hypothetical protein
LYVICESNQEADKISKLDIPDDRYDRIFGRPRPKSKDAELIKLDPLEGEAIHIPKGVINGGKNNKDSIDEEG